MKKDMLTSTRRAVARVATGQADANLQTARQVAAEMQERAVLRRRLNNLFKNSRRKGPKRFPVHEWRTCDWERIINSRPQWGEQVSATSDDLYVVDYSLDTQKYGRCVLSPCLGCGSARQAHPYQSKQVHPWAASCWISPHGSECLSRTSHHTAI